MTTARPSVLVKNMRRVLLLLALLLAFLCEGACRPRSESTPVHVAAPVVAPVALPSAPSSSLDAGHATAHGGCVRVGRLADWRYSPSVSALDGGRVLVAGGRHHDGVDFLRSAEIWDPTSATFRSAASLHDERAMHAAVTLRDGRVLVAGGLATRVELYDPKRSSWAIVGALRTPVVTPFAGLLSDGRVLLAGGDLQWKGAFSSETNLFDPSQSKLVRGPDLAPDEGGSEPGVAITLDGKLLLVPGASTGEAKDLAGWLFDPSVGAYSKWTGKDARLAAIRALDTAPQGPWTLISAGDGTALHPAIAVSDDSVRRYDAAAGEWIATARFLDKHEAGGAVAIDEHTVFVVGGLEEVEATAERCTF